MIREHTERLKTPRALHCQFPLGRPLGKPNDPTYQRSVLDAAFALLDSESGPVLVDFPDTIEDAAAEPLACSVPPRMDESVHAAIDEARGLRKAYDRNLEATGRTNVGRVADVDAVPELVGAFVKIADGTKWKEAGVPDNNLLEATKDILSYYEEAATALAEHTPEARAAESWFYNATACGSLMKDVKGTLKESGWPAWMYITPMTQ